jgi:DNA polymerase
VEWDSSLKDELLKLHEVILRCGLCRLSESRKNAVPGEGSFDALLMLVGEAPGVNEDLLGRPFVGAAGAFLNDLLSSVGVDRSSIFITNIVKCRPPMNRPPRIDEVKACHSYLERQIALINPRIICLMGNNAIKGVLGKGYSIATMHGKQVQTVDRRFFLTYHPAAALYMNELKKTMIEDFKALSEVLKSQI